MKNEQGCDSLVETSSVKRTEVAMLRVAVALAASVVMFASAGWAQPQTALAGPSDVPCPLSMVIMCRFLPIAPELDDDVDLTKPPGGDPGSPDPQPPDLLSPDDPMAPVPVPQPADICINGCI